jgi:hypothetical protein
MPSLEGVNDKGYEVELLRSIARPKGALAVIGAETDIWPMQASTDERLLPAPGFSQVVVSL